MVGVRAVAKRQPPAKPIRKPPMAEPRQITEIAEREAALFKAEQARQFLDCAIHLCATSMSILALIRLLEDHAEILKEFG